MRYHVPVVSKKDLLQAEADNLTPTEAAARFGTTASTISKHCATHGISLRDGRDDEARRRRRTRRVKMDTVMADVAAGMSEVAIADKYGVPLHRAVFAHSLHRERAAREA